MVALVRERGVTIEACPTSNLHTGAIPDLSNHPLPCLLEAGVAVTVCTDNTLLSDTDAPREYRLAASRPGLDPPVIATLAACGHSAAFRRRDSAASLA